MGLVAPSEVEACVKHQAQHRQLAEVLKTMGLKANHVQSVLMRVEKRGEPIQQVMRDTRFLSEEKVALVMASLNGIQHFADNRTHACDFARVLKSMDRKKLAMPQYDGYVPVAVLDNDCIAIALEDVEKTNDAHNFFSAYPNKLFLLASSHTLQKITRSNYTRTEEAMLKAIDRVERLVKSEIGSNSPREEMANENQGYMRELIGLILRHATYSGASDVHFQCSSYCGKLSMRYDGVLRDVAFYDPHLHERITTMLTTDGVLGTQDGDVANTVMRGKSQLRP
jgi:type II secretory ATPase GspE/PulE/Tfp pilus assembly ATPase PilB-like protein